MSSIKISQLPEASNLSGEERLPVVQMGQTVGASVAQIRAGLLTSDHAENGAAAHPAAVAGGAAGFMSGADKAKLDGIQPGATVNSPDSHLLDRNNHTGRQSHTTITGLGTMATRSAAEFAALSGATFTGPVTAIGQICAVSITGDGGTAPNLLVMAPGTAQGQRTGIGFCPTFMGTEDNGPRRAADIVAGYDTHPWGYEYLAIHVGRGGADNDGQALTTERLRIDGSGNIVPGADNAQNFGTPNRRWAQLYAGTGVINTSDEREKENIARIDLDLAKALLKMLDPVTFKWRDIDQPVTTEVRRTVRQKTEPGTVVREVVERVGDVFVRRQIEETVAVPVFTEHPLYDESGEPLIDAQGNPILHREPVMEEVEEEIVTSTAFQKVNRRTHWGFVAQQVEQGLCRALGMDPADPVQVAQARLRFAGLVHDAQTDRYGLREGQFIPILWATLRDLLDRVEALESSRLAA